MRLAGSSLNLLFKYETSKNSDLIAVQDVETAPIAWLTID